ncbi:MAG: CocE/NonD family hydrolase [Candidatus Acidiferrales bacterium]
MIDCGNGVRLERGVRCRISDGVELVSDHYYPPQADHRAGPQPTLLMRQPYGRDIASTVVYAHPAWFARHGYNVVIQDVRGRGDSGGDFYPFRHEAQDGAETIAWLRARPESNGRVGMYGFSYQGITQLLAAARQPEGLQCIAPGMTACDLYQGWFYNNGALRLASTLGWGLQMLKEDTRRRKLREASDRLEQAWANFAAQTSFLPFREHPALHGEGVPQYVVDWFDHAEPGEYWRELDVSHSISRINVPALHVSGWYDMYLKGNIEGFLALREHAGSAAAREHQYLIAGPWLHIPWGDRIGAADFGAEALLDTDAILLRWFNHWLKDSGEFEGEPRIRHFVLGENHWRNAETLPTEANHHLYLHSGGRANSRKGDGTLSDMMPAAGEPCDVFVYDPEVPVLAPGGASAASGQFDQAAIELGNNVLVYTSKPLVKPLHVLGFPRVTLYCSSSAAHTDFTAKLVRVKPSGAAEFICIGIARSSYLFRETGYSADKIHSWHFSLEPTSCLFAAGEKIRLEIASSAFPLYDRNPGTAVPSCRATSWDWWRSTQFVYHDAKHWSALHLPVIEAAP